MQGAKDLGECFFTFDMAAIYEQAVQESKLFYKNIVGKGCFCYSVGICPQEPHLTANHVWSTLRFEIALNLSIVTQAL